MSTKHDTLLRLKRLTDELTTFQALLRQEQEEDVKKSLQLAAKEIYKSYEAYKHYERKIALLRDYNSRE